MIGDKFYTKEEVTNWVNRQPEYLLDENDLRIIDEDGLFIVSGYVSGMLTYEVDVPSDGDVPGLIGQRSYRCVICALAFKEKDISMFRGKPYGRPCGCFKDIKSIIEEERGDRKRSSLQNRDYNRR